MLRSICVDFDRVIHSYTTPWSGTTSIPDPPNKGAFQWLTEMVQHYDVHIFSARCQDAHGVNAVRLWMRKHGLSEEVIAKLQFPLGKQSAILYIDDRAFRFQGRFPTTEEVKAFRPWHPDDNKDRPVQESISDPVDVEEHIERLAQALVTLATDSPDAPLVSYSGEFTMPDGRVYRCSVEHVLP